MTIRRRVLRKKKKFSQKVLSAIWEEDTEDTEDIVEIEDRNFGEFSAKVAKNQRETQEESKIPFPVEQFCRLQVFPRSARANRAIGARQVAQKSLYNKPVARLSKFVLHTLNILPSLARRLHVVTINSLPRGSRDPRRSRRSTTRGGLVVRVVCSWPGESVRCVVSRRIRFFFSFCLSFFSLLFLSR